MRYVVRTPENVEFEYALAGLASRFAAWLIDSAFSTVFVFLGLFIVSLAQGGGLQDARVGLGGGIVAFLGLLVVFAAQWGYYVIGETMTGGQTPGKKMLSW